MNIEDVNIVANRRKLNEEAHYLREKLTKENARTIKLMVSQDAMYWELNEKLKQVEGDRERMQQNMLELQMQYETLSGQYQDELRLRPEILNKLCSTRKICEVLEEHTERLRQSLSRTIADHAALYDAYQRSGKVVCEFQQRHVQIMDTNRQVIQDLQNRVKLMSEYQLQLSNVLSSTKQQADKERSDLNHQLDKALKRGDELSTNVSDITRKLDLAHLDVKKKDEAMSILQKEMKQMLNNFNNQINDSKETFLKKDNDLKDALNEIASLRQALSNQDTFTKTVCEQNNELQDNLAIFNEKHQDILSEYELFKVKFEEMTTSCNNLKDEITSLVALKEDLMSAVKEKAQTIILYEDQLEKLKAELNSNKQKLDTVSADYKISLDELENKSKYVKELESKIEILNKKANDVGAEFKNYSEFSESTLQKKSAMIEELNRELEAKTAKIIEITYEMQNGTEERRKLHAALQSAGEQIENEVKSAEEAQKRLNCKIEQLETAVRSKDEELSKNMSKILEMRNESEREKCALRNKIDDMQKKIDNIMKEATAPSARAVLLSPEPDDNAIELTPRLQLVTPPRAAIIQRRDSFEDRMYMCFSDRSAEGDSIDSQEIIRRFEMRSRGEHLPRMPLSSLKRQRDASAPSNALRTKLLQPPSIERPSHQTKNGPFSIPQVKSAIKSNEPRFFKSKERAKKIKKN